MSNESLNRIREAIERATMQLTAYGANNTTFLCDAIKEINSMGEAKPKLADASLDASEVRGSAARTMEETSPANPETLNQGIFKAILDAITPCFKVSKEAGGDGRTVAIVYSIVDVAEKAAKAVENHSQSEISVNKTQCPWSKEDIESMIEGVIFQMTGSADSTKSWMFPNIQTVKELLEYVLKTTKREVSCEKCNAEMLRVKACEHIAEGDEGWEKLRDICPSTMAVANLRDLYEESGKQLEEVRPLEDFELVQYARFLSVLKPEAVEQFKLERPGAWEVIKPVIEYGGSNA